MSRIGKQPIVVPSGVTVALADGRVRVDGPKGSLSQALVEHVGLEVEGAEARLTRDGEAKQVRANHGLMRSLVQNMVTGVTVGFEKKLSVLGVGYRADVKGSTLVMQLGYSHPINFSIPAGVVIDVDKQNNIVVKGIDKQAVGQAAAEIRAFRKPDHYKGKGIRYADEYVRIKAGKSA